MTNCYRRSAAARSLSLRFLGLAPRLYAVAAPRLRDRCRCDSWGSPGFMLSPLRGCTIVVVAIPGAAQLYAVAAPRLHDRCRCDSWGWPRLYAVAAPRLHDR